MQTVVVIGDENLKELIKSYMLVKSCFIYLPLAESYSEIELSTIESADIVLVAVDSIDSAKLLLKRYPLKMLDKTICMCPRKNLLTVWNQKKLFKHAVVCRQGELHHAIQGLLEILTKQDLLDLDATDILTFCTEEVTEIYYCEAKKEILQQELANVQKLLRKQKHDFMIYMNGDISLVDVENMVHMLRIKGGEDVILGMGYREGASVLKVCILFKRC